MPGSRGFADDGMGEALGVYYTRYFPVGALIIVAHVVVVSPLLFPDEPNRWKVTAQLGFFVFALCALVGGLIYNATRLKPRVELGSNLAIVLPLEKEEQKYLRRVINGQEPVPDKHLTVARAVAVQTRKGTATSLLVAPMYSYPIGAAFGQLTWFWIILAAVFAGVTVFRYATSGVRDSSWLPPHPRVTSRVGHLNPWCRPEPGWCPKVTPRAKRQEKRQLP